MIVVTSRWPQESIDVKIWCVPNVVLPWAVLLAQRIAPSTVQITLTSSVGGAAPSPYGSVTGTHTIATHAIV